MFIATNHSSNTLRSVRSEISFQPASTCTRLLRSYGVRAHSMTSGYKHLPRWGEIRQHQLVAHQT
jgi:hypothetical protein